MALPSLSSMHKLPSEQLAYVSTNFGRPGTQERHMDALTCRLGDANAFGRRGAAEALGSSGLALGGAKGAAFACRLSDVDTHTRVNTAYALVRSGMPKAPRAMEQAKRLLTGDPRNRQGCVEALAHMGEAGAAALAGILDHPNSDVEIRRLVTKALGRMGQLAAAQAGVLARCVRDDDEFVRANTAEALVLLTPSCRPRLGNLSKKLHNDTSDVGTGISNQGQADTRRRALEEMGQRGASAAPFAHEIASHLQDDDQGVRRRAAETLARIGVNGGESAVSPHSSKLTKCLLDSNHFVRTSAIDAITEMGPMSASCVRDLALALLDYDPHVRSKAARALGRIGPPASQYIKELVGMFRDKCPEPRKEAAEAVLQMGMAAAPYANDLAMLLDDDAIGLRFSLADGLRNLGPAGAEALLSRMADGNPMVRETARTTLQLMGWQTGIGSQVPQTARTFQYREQADVGNKIPSHIMMRSRGPKSSLGQSASPRLYRRAAAAPTLESSRAMY